MGKKKDREEKSGSGAPEFHEMAGDPDEEGIKIEEGAYDYARYYEDIILTHSDFKPTPTEELVPDEVMESFDQEAAEFERLTEVIDGLDKMMSVDISDELKSFDFPELLEEEIDPVVKEKKKKPFHKIPDGIDGRLFTVRKKGWRGRIWKVIQEDGGAKSDDDLQEIPDEMIETLAGSEGFVVLSGSDYSVVEKTKANERELIEKWRDQQEEKKDKEEEIVDLTGLDISKIQAVEKVMGYKLTIDQDYIKNLVEHITAYGITRMPQHNPEAFKIISLVFMPSVLNGKVVVRDGWKDKIYPNLYTVIIGPPSTQKSTAFQNIHHVAKSAIPDISYHVDWTKEALGVEFQTNRTGVVWKDEFAQILDPDIREGYMNGVLEFLMVCYDEDEYSTHRIDEKRNLEVEGVNIGFGATIQTERFYKLVTDDDVNSGFFNRFCYIILWDQKEPPKQTLYTKEIDTHKKMIVRALREVRKTLDHVDVDYPVLFEYDDEALDILNKWYVNVDAHCRSYGGIRAMSLIAVASRVYTMAKKVGLVYEVLDLISQGVSIRRDRNNEMPTYMITATNIQKGIDFAQMCFKNSEYLYHRLRSTDVAVKLERFMDILRSPRSTSIVVRGHRGEPGALYAMKRSDLLRNVGMKLRDFEDYLHTFMVMEKLFRFKMKLSSTARKPAEMICTFQHPIPNGIPDDPDERERSGITTDDIMRANRIEDNIRKYIKDQKDKKAKKAKKAKKDKEAKKDKKDKKDKREKKTKKK